MIGAVVASGLMVPATQTIAEIPSFAVPEDQRDFIGIAAFFGRLIPCLIAVALGVLLPPPRLNPNAPPCTARRSFWTATIGGLGLSMLTISAGLLLREHLPSLPDDLILPPVWQGVAMLAGAAYFEELLFRFGLVSLCLFLVRRLSGERFSERTCRALGVAIPATLFALVHLLPLAGILELDRVAALGAFCVTLLAGLGFGKIFVDHGIQYSILAHVWANTSLYLVVRCFFLDPKHFN